VAEDLYLAFEGLNLLKYLCIKGLEDISFLHHILHRHEPSLKRLILGPNRRCFKSPEGPHCYGYFYPYLGSTQIQELAAS
jgi:hypothetical protein